MARTITKKRPYRDKPIITLTRFYLPEDKEWPVWEVPHRYVHHGPVAGVEGVWSVSLGRMVENREKAVYIIVWETLRDLRNFQSSAACGEFLRNLPEGRVTRSATKKAMAMSNASSSSSSPAATSRFLTLYHLEGTPTAQLEGRVTLNSLVVSRQEPDLMTGEYAKLKCALSRLLPHTLQFLKSERYFSWQYLTVWFKVLTQDRWAIDEFGTLEVTDEGRQIRSMICEFHVWPEKLGVTREEEEKAAKDSETIELWRKAVDSVTPPVTAWVQERWDISDAPRYDTRMENKQEDNQENKEENKQENKQETITLCLRGISS
ncbi:hypothetical protein QBC40DRAFT_199757 [Triangularia verruculosa]|uniref:Uncharacterized protein n=1 Tax=Triangularia verruculosa TaxID=2587418 RepID=A0AAN6XI94_9PEZI|nr:hypothetical protein QBC40DRAFT_199757 [Triangularia verruculosa]